MTRFSSVSIVSSPSCELFAHALKRLGGGLTAGSRPNVDERFQSIAAQFPDHVRVGQAGSKPVGVTAHHERFMFGDDTLDPVDIDGLKVGRCGKSLPRRPLQESELRRSGPESFQRSLFAAEQDLRGNHRSIVQFDGAVDIGLP